MIYFVKVLNLMIPGELHWSFRSLWPASYCVFKFYWRWQQILIPVNCVGLKEEKTKHWGSGGMFIIDILFLSYRVNN